jgi:hypothetical protein
MSEQNNIDPHVCNAGVPVTTVEAAPAPDVHLVNTDDAEPGADAAADTSKRRAPFAAPAEDKKRTSGGLDSLGKGYLP